jgi:hypothetical protein
MDNIRVTGSGFTRFFNIQNRNLWLFPALIVVSQSSTVRVKHPLPAMYLIFLHLNLTVVCFLF